jgi:hypothetical protein
MENEETLMSKKEQAARQAAIRAHVCPDEFEFIPYPEGFLTDD